MSKHWGNLEDRSILGKSENTNLAEAEGQGPGT